MPVEINELSATARIGAPDPAVRLSDQEVERIARRVIALLRQEGESRRIARPEPSVRSALGQM
ncbi:MAG: hypothetical protein AAF675_16250 [Pseudomonadota bacterium]